MIKQSAETGFVLSVFKPELEGQTSPWGVHVEVIDFDRTPDGLLSIVIKANNLVSLNSLQSDNDGLRHSAVTAIKHWPDMPQSEESLELAAQLNVLMEEHQIYGDLYLSPNYDAEPQWHSPVWVCRRWLEILPMSYEYRKKFIQDDTYLTAQNYIKTMVLALQISSKIKNQ